MITVGLLALLAVAWRIRKRLFTRAEAVLAAIVVINLGMVWAQIVVADHVAFPEKRYWIQSFVLVCGWAVWGVDRAAATLAARVPVLRYALPAALAVLAVLDVVMVLKPQIPFGRRYAYVQACTWAEDLIRKDWHGPEKDDHNPFAIQEYHRPNRPVVQAFTRRLPYVLDGRKDNEYVFGALDTPDYIAVDTKKEVRRPGPKYEKIGAATFASRTFEVYRLKKRANGDGTKGAVRPWRKK